MKRNDKLKGKVSANYIDKGVYSHKQVNGYMVVKQFMVVEREEKRCLILRFLNESDFEVNAMIFTVTQRDTAGEIIGTSNIKLTHLSVAAGELFSPESGVIIAPECADFEVEMQTVISGKYRYVFKGRQVTAHYDKRGYEDGVNAVHIHSHEGKSTAIRKYYTKGRLYRFIAVATLLSVLISIILSVAINETINNDKEYKEDIYQQYVDGMLK